MRGCFGKRLMNIKERLEKRREKRELSILSVILSKRVKSHVTEMFIFVGAKEY